MSTGSSAFFFIFNFLLLALHITDRGDVLGNILFFYEKYSSGYVDLPSILIGIPVGNKFLLIIF